MTITAQIRCVNKTPRRDPHLRISHVGGINPGGERWRLTTDQAIQGIENADYHFYVEVNGRHADVVVAVSALGNKYLRTTTDNTMVDNLLSLPECI